MSSLTHPADYSVAELKDALEEIDDIDRLDRLLERERAGDDRVTAVDAIEQRLEAVQSLADERDDSEADVSAHDVDESSAVPHEDTIEDGWSKDTVVGRGERAVTDRATASADNGSVDRARADQAIESVRSESAAENGEVVHEPLDVSSKRAEALSLPTTEAVADEHVGERLIENIERIRHTFENKSSADGRMEARIRQLQTDVGDLKSYTNALEEFLDEEGTGRQVIESVRSDLASLEDTLAGVTDDVQVHGRNLATLWDVIEDVESELSRIHDRLERQHRDLTDVADDVEAVERALDDVREAADERSEAHAARFETVDETLADHGDTLGDYGDTLGDYGDTLSDLDSVVTSVDERVDAVAEETDSVADRVDSVATNLHTLEAEVDDRLSEGSAEHSELLEQVEHNTQAIEELSTEVADIAAAVEALEELVGDSGSVDQRFGAIEDEIQDLHEWREQLSSVLLSSANGEPNPAD